MGQVRSGPAVAGHGLAQGDRQPERQADPRRPMQPPEGRRSPRADPALQDSTERPPPDITAPFLAAVLARVAANLCGPDTDDPQA